MKKIISLLFVLAMLFACTVPSFAVESGPIELEVGANGNVCIDDGKSYIISKNCTIQDLEIKSGKLTIAPEATVWVLRQFYIDKFVQVNVEGTLQLGSIASYTVNGKLTVLCSGQLLGFQKTQAELIRYGNFIFSPHVFQSGVCMFCGYECPHKEYDNGVCTACSCECPHENGFTDARCNDCGYECSHTQTHTGIICDCCGIEIQSTAIGSILSNGYPEIVYGVGGIAIGFISAMFIFRKKKNNPAMCEDMVNDNKE